MTQDPINSLLHAADAAAGAPPTPPVDLPQRVLARAEQRRRQRRATGAAAAMLALALGVGLAWHALLAPAIPSAPVPPSVAQVDAAQLRAEVAALDAQARAGQAVVDRLLAAQRPAPALSLAPRDPLDRIDQQVEQAAVTVVAQADWMAQDLGLADSARQEYRAAIQWFPQTFAAGIARQRLARAGG